MNRFYNERPYGVGEYVDHLLGEQQVLLKRELREHTENNDIHVTAEDKERWNSTSEAIFGSSDSSDGDTSSTIIPTKVSDLENDVPYLKEDDLSMYATEAEVRSWLDNYVTITDYEAGEGNHYSGNEGEYVDGDIIDKFQIDDTKAALAGAKSVYLAFEDNKLSVKVAKAQTASLKLIPDSLEYKSSGTVLARATFTPAEMQSLEVHSALDGTPRDASNGDVSYSITNFAQQCTFTLNYTPVSDTPGSAHADLKVAKRYYVWYDNANSSHTLTTSEGTLLTGKPSSIAINAPSGKYTYLAFPKSWNVNVDNFKVGGFDFGNLAPVDANGPYGDTDDYIIVRSTEAGLEGTITT